MLIKINLKNKFPDIFVISKIDFKFNLNYLIYKSEQLHVGLGLMARPIFRITVLQCKKSQLFEARGRNNIFSDVYLDKKQKCLYKSQLQKCFKDMPTTGSSKNFSSLFRRNID